MAYPVHLQAFADAMPGPIAKALTAYGEARSQPVLGVAGVMAVIDNRVATGRWGHTINEVVFARRQFSCWDVGDPNLPMLRDLAERFVTGQTAFVRNITLDCCVWMAGQTFTDPTNRATHYYAPRMLAEPPAWTKPPARRTTQIGDHIFYADVA